MNTIEFILGIIVAVVVVQATVILMIILRIRKFSAVEEKLKEIEREASSSVDLVYRQIEEENRNRVSAIDDVYRQIDVKDKDVYKHIDVKDKDARRFIEDVGRSLRDEIKTSLSDSKSYTDSRIDKLKN